MFPRFEIIKKVARDSAVKPTAIAIIAAFTSVERVLDKKKTLIAKTFFGI
jgi:hypothetical protein